MDEDSFKQDDLNPDTDLFIPGRDQEKLSEDGATPAAPPNVSDENMPQDYPTTDTDQDPGEVYLAGNADAAGYTPNPETNDNEVTALPLDHEEQK